MKTFRLLFAVLLLWCGIATNVYATETTNSIDITSCVSVAPSAYGGSICSTEYAPAVTTSDGRTAPMAEKYEETVNNVGVKLSQKISDLGNGTYTVVLCANALYTSGRGFESDLTDGATDVAYVFANGVQTPVTAHIGTSVDTNGEYTIEAVEVTDGTLELGIAIAKAGTNWHTLQIKSLVWHTTKEQSLEHFKSLLKSSIDKAKALSVNVDEFTAVIAAAQDVYDNSVDVTELTTAYFTLKASIEMCENKWYFADGHLVIWANFSKPYWESIKNAITSVTIKEGVTEIGQFAFSGCSGLTGELVIPNSVVYIGSGAFRGCTGLTGELVIPCGVTHIGNSAFSDCSGLTGELIIPSGVTTIESHTFSGCSGFTSVVMSSGVTNIGYHAFGKCKGITSITIPNGVNSIEEQAFSGCTNLTGELVIPNSVESIGSWAFHSCGFESIIIGDGVTSIGEYAFYSCEKLKKVVFGSNVRMINSYAFYSTAITEVTSKAMTPPSLGEAVFFDLDSYWGHDKILLIYPEEANYLEWAKDYFTSPNFECNIFRDSKDYDIYTEWYFDNKGNAIAYGKGELKGWIKGDTKRLYIKEGITSIGANHFERIQQLEEVYLDGNLTSIGDYAFNYCENLKKIVFSESLTSIGDYAFNECIRLKNIFLPKSLNSIGDYAFYNVPIEFVVIPQFVTSVGNNAFSPCYYYDDETDESVYYDPILVFKSFNAPYMGDFDSWMSICVPEGANSYPTGKFNNIELFYPQEEYYIKYYDDNGEWGYKMYVFGNTDNVNHYNGNIQEVNSIVFTPDATGYNLISLLPNVRKVDVLRYKMEDRNLYTFEGSNAVFKYLEDQPEETVLVAGCATTVIPDGTTRIEEHAFYECTGLKNIEIPSSVKSIGYEAFKSCTGLERITIPRSVTDLGSYVFCYCTGLKEAVVNGGSLYYEAFGNCANLKSLTIGENVKSISSDAFRGCTELTNITVDSENPVYDSRESCNAIIETASNKYILASKSAVIPTSVTSIGRGAFAACVDYNLTVPTTVTSIDNGAFSGLNRLYFESDTPVAIAGNVFGRGAIYVPASAYETYCNADVWKDYKDRIVTTELAEKDIEVWSTEGMSGILNEVGLNEADKVVKLKVKGEINSYDMIVIRDKMPLLNELDLSEATVVASSKPFYQTYCTGKNSLGGYAFYDLDKLVSVKLPKDLTTLGNYAFKGCDKLEYVDASATSELNIGTSTFEQCIKLTEFVSPEKISEVGDNAFTYCSKLEGIELRDIAGSIGTKAFSNCGKLKTIDINSIGGDIQKQAFYYSSSLEDIRVGTIGGNLGDEAFGYCQSLKNVEFENGPIKIGSRIFVFSDNLETFVAGEGTTEVADRAFYAIKLEITSWGTKEVNIPRPNLKKVILPQGVQKIGKEAFYRCTSLKDFTMPQSVTSIGESAFYYCSSIESVTIPNGITSIANSAFSGCSSLKDITFPNELTTIGTYAFQYCAFETLKLPPTLKTISNGAFYGCSSLRELHIPSAMEKIGSNSFSSCYNLNAVYTYTVEPTEITETTFSTFASATLYVPATSFWNYYWDIGWSKFNHKNFKDFNEKYDYFYLNNDYYLNGETGYIQGTPDADLRPGSGLVVESDKDAENDDQTLGDVTVGSDGNGNSASIVGDENLTIENLHVKINVKGGRWYFFAFPWDVPMKKISMQGGSDYVFRYYDGEERAKKGNGGWKDVHEPHLKAARGYIFQCSADDVLLLSIEDVKFKKEDKYNELVTHTSENLNDASWNLMGNPYLSYYDMEAMDYSAPVTVWDGEKYVAIRPGDDDYQFAPYEAFFVQKPEGEENIGFTAEEQMTKIQAETAMAQKVAARRARGINPNRLLINLELSIDSITDRTRVVFNNSQSHNYETACDAAKFESAGVPQIYTIDNEGVRYAINERPVGNGVVLIGYTAAENGYYTIEATRMDTKVCLYDAETKILHNLDEGSYTFFSGKGTFEARFSLGIRDGETTGIEDLSIDEAVEVIDGGILLKGNAVANVYNASGMLVAVQKGAGIVHLPVGTYVVSIGEQSKKVVVK